ncbi:MAG: lysylphosphatidylglycerol synthase transmembrane domain-containing protein [Tepidisphaeraceae bacterium]
MHSRDSRARKWAKFILRWTIAIVGIGWVVLNTPLHNKVTFVGADKLPVKATLAQDVGDNFTQADIYDPVTGEIRTVRRDELVNTPDKKTILVRDNGATIKRKLLALDLTDDLKTVRRFLVQGTDGAGEWVAPDQVEKYELGVPYPLVDQGIVPMVRHADRSYLLAAIAIFPLTFLLTGLRWHLLLTAVAIHIGAAKAFVINMVGAFYNTFLPGSTGGDVIKAVYAARLAPDHRTRAVMTVLIDRVIGLLGLIMLGGAMAAYLAVRPEQVGEAVAKRCAQVAIGAAAILSMTALGLAVIYIPLLRRITGFDFLIARLPGKVRERAEKALHTMEIYRQRPGYVLAALLITFPVHITVIFSAMCSGMAFNLPLTAGYYWVVVPVVVLAGAIPISPQGAGVMEFFAILLTRKQGCTVSQAFALTMSIRLVQILWNLVGGLFVLRGGYQAPTEKEQEEVEDAEDSEDDEETGMETDERRTSNIEHRTSNGKTEAVP